VTQWKKIITSGSSADLNQITASVISLGGIGDVSSSIAALSTTNGGADNDWHINSARFYVTSSNSVLLRGGSGKRLKFNISMSTGNSSTLGAITFANELIFPNSTPFNIPTLAMIGAQTTQPQNEEAGGTELIFRATKKDSTDSDLVMKINSDDGVSIATNITASGNISASGDIEANSFTIQGFNFTSVDSNTVVYSGSTQFGSGSFPSNTTHQFTGSVLITGSKLELTGGTLSIPGYTDVSASLSSIGTDLTNVTTNILPDSTANERNIGSSTKKFNDLFAVNTFFGGVHEINLETEGLDQMQEGTVLSLKDGILQPCEKDSDSLVMGVVSKGRNYPIVLGAEPVLVTGKIKVGDYIITSKIKGHGKGVSPRHIYSKLLFGKVIAQAIEDGEGKSYTIKAMIRKM